jgi:methionyl-tRNA synthetase
MLKLHGFVLPSNVPANEFMNLEGDKMSTSRSWKLDMQDYIDDFVVPENGGSRMADVLRYYLTSIAPETKDSEFTWKGFQDANNSELVAIFGNFVNRTLVLMHKLCKGKVPPLHEANLDHSDRALSGEIRHAALRVEKLLEAYKFRDAQFEVMELARKGNKYMQEKEPWILAKTLEEAKRTDADYGQKTALVQALIDNCLHLCLQLTANLAILFNPFLPVTARHMLHLLKVVDRMLAWENSGKLDLLRVGYSLRPPELLFRKIEDQEINYQMDKLRKETGSPAPLASPGNGQEGNVPARKPEISFEDFAKLDLLVGTILRAEKVEKTDKLLKLEIDLGGEKRTIVSGIAQQFAPEEITGRQVVVVANLAPRKMRGIESNGMILLAGDKEGKLHFIHPDSRIDDGSGVS